VPGGVAPILEARRLVGAAEFVCVVAAPEVGERPDRADGLDVCDILRGVGYVELEPVEPGEHRSDGTLVRPACVVDQPEAADAARFHLRRDDSHRCTERPADPIELVLSEKGGHLEDVAGVCAQPVWSRGRDIAAATAAQVDRDHLTVAVDDEKWTEVVEAVHVRRQPVHGYH